MLTTVVRAVPALPCTCKAPQNMQDQPQYQDPFAEISLFFSEKIQACYAAGINDVILDPGFGFGKK